MLIIRIAEVPPATLTGSSGRGLDGTLEPWKRISMGARVEARVVARAVKLCKRQGF